MKYSNDQLILASHVRELALEFRRGERNAMSNTWHAENPGREREMSSFADELNTKKSLNEFIVQAHKELQNISKIIEKSSELED